MLKVLSLFSGIGAFEKALEKLNIDYELVGFSEIDKYAIKSYCAIHGVDESLNLGDVTKIDTSTLPKDVDLLTHGSPCQDFSMAGKQAGGDKDSGTRSSLMYETIRIIGDIKPKYIIWENVKNLLSKKHIHNFNNYLKALDELGYNSYYQVLNSKDYGIPQNRERVFTVSILGDRNFKFPERDINDNKIVEHNPKGKHQQDLIQDEEGLCRCIPAGTHGSTPHLLKTVVRSYEFPPKQELKLRLKDILEDNVDEKYYLSDEKISKIAHWKAHQKPFERVNGKESIVPTLTARGAGEDHSGMITFCEQLENTTNLQEQCLYIKNNTKQGYLEAEDGDGVNICGRMQYQRGNVQKGMSLTLDTQNTKGVVVDDKPICVGNYINKTSQCGKIYDPNGISMTVCAGTHGYATGNIEEKSGCNLRIRKLTPKECWRLMGFDDEDIDKCSAIGISNTQLYKQAGNSIVVNVLVEIFKELLKESVK